MTIERFQKHGETAKADLLGQFQGKANIEGLLDAIAPQFNELDDALVDLVLERTLTTAVGTQLEQLASVVGIDRGSSDDTELRARIRTEIRLNRSEGSVEDILEVMALALGSEAVELDEYFPASLIVRALVATALDPETLGRLLQRARAAGVKAHWESFTGTPVFALGNSADTRPTANIGSGTNGTVTVELTYASSYASAWTIQVVIPGPSHALTVLVDSAAKTIVVELETDGIGDPDPAFNVAGLVAAAITAADKICSATASGTGLDPLSTAEGPTAFSGGSSAADAHGVEVAGLGTSTDANVGGELATVSEG